MLVQLLHPAVMLHLTHPIHHQGKILPRHLHHVKILLTKFLIIRHPLQGLIHLTHHLHMHHRLPIHHVHPPIACRTYRLLEGIMVVVTIHQELAVIIYVGRPQAQLATRKSTRLLMFGLSSRRKGTNTSATFACTSLNFPFTPIINYYLAELRIAPTPNAKSQALAPLLQLAHYDIICALII